MDDDVELAQTGLEHAKEVSEEAEKLEQRDDRGARKIAILISTLAAALALSEMTEKGTQNEYLTHHIAASDAWAFYQAKTIRADMQRDTAAVLDSLPNAADPEVHKRSQAALAAAARLDDDDKTRGRKQLRAEAEKTEQARDDAFEHYHKYERVVGALQISIVLASVAVVTRTPLLAWVAGGIGVLAAAYEVGVTYAGW